MRKYLTLFIFMQAIVCHARERIQLAAVPSVSPDGRQFAFSWRNDVWVASLKGGDARRLTSHPAEDHWPSWSPDGKEIAFSSKRDGYWNIYTVTVSGGVPRRITAHSEGYTSLEWNPDGKTILTKVKRDHGGWNASRLANVAVDGNRRDKLAADAYAEHGTYSPDGSKLLFTREGRNLLYRKGYRGGRASQIWLLELATGRITPQCLEEYGCRSPLWKPDGSGFYYVCDQSGSFNLWEQDLASGNRKQLTHYSEDAIILPRIALKSGVIVFRMLFDFYRFDPSSGKPPTKINLWYRQDDYRKESRRRWYSSAWNNEARQGVGWSDDFLEVAFTAGGDLWLMDTVLREPVLVCGETATHETEVVFGVDNHVLWFLRDRGDRVEIWKAQRKSDDQYWFRNKQFTLTKFCSDSSTKNRLSLSPDGKNLAFCRAPGEVVVTPTQKYAPKVIASSIVYPGYDWSPDGRWLAVQSKDSEDNWDVWLVSLHGESEPYNLSRHPEWDGSPRWSPDGRKLVFVGKRGRTDEYDLHYVYLIPDDEPQPERSIKLNEALDKIQSARKPPSPVVPPHPPPPLSVSPDKPHPVPKPENKPKKRLPRVVIDFDNLHERVRRIPLSGSKETDPFWNSDSKRLAFTSELNRKHGLYFLRFPDDLSKPIYVTGSVGADPYWNGSQIHWLVDNIPAKTQGSSLTKYDFKAYQETNREEYLRLAFRTAWRLLRDHFYDEEMNGLDWETVLRKYEKAITADIDFHAYGRLLQMLMGELNASHLFFDLNEKRWPQWAPDHGWRWHTVHLGLIFDESYGGLGLKVARVLPEGPCSGPHSRVYEDEVITKVDGIELVTAKDYRRAFNRRLNKVMELEVKNPVGSARTVLVQPISYGQAGDLLRKVQIADSRVEVEKRSRGKLGYLHVSRMNWDDLERFEAELFSIGYGKEGLVVDVRNNLGGFTADRMLKMLSRPLHAVTVPRGGERSYPLGYLDHFYWDKPIVVLCNQNTASNGEIFCHAIKATKRGKLVGTRTVGGVISIYSGEKFLDVGDMSLPFRGWYKLDDGRDMEGNGAVPDFEVRPFPGDMSAGKDRQLEKAVEVLLEECRGKKDVTEVELVPASAALPPKSVPEKKEETRP